MEIVLKPVFVKIRDIQPNSGPRANDFEIMTAASSVVGEAIQCIQQDCGLWLIYIADESSREKAVLERLEPSESCAGKIRAVRKLCWKD
jgi:hypothetical protein